jgi:hypothetical protein
MARVLKGRRQAYDNIAVGSENSAVERTISGSLPPSKNTIGNGENIAVASDYGEERVIAGALLPEGERLTP